jgi:hypothetical protein
MSRNELGKAAFCSYSLVHKIERGDRVPTLEFAQTCDRVFPHANERFTRLWRLVIKHAYPSWFRPFVELEAGASEIRSFQVQVVPGLLQTADYARAVLSASRLHGAQMEELVAARMERQHILSRDNPPELWVALDENVLHRRHGTPEVFGAQLARLLEEAETPSIVIQVIPYAAGGHAGLGGPFSALTMDEGPSVVYVDGFARGQILADPADVRAAARVYDLLTAVALSPSASLDLIRAHLKELTA